ncbi:MAG: sugar phosphate isomerase/epimerase [Rhizobiaceae bacterium]|nr:sugar phosphate isomerase/epimerase [Rhizobiaceae bacterium]
MKGIKMGCQTYTWQMSGELYLGKLDHIIAVAGKSGFQGIEPETQFLGALRDPGVMRSHLDKAGMELASVCLVEKWRQPKENDSEREAADWVIDYLARNFPDTVLNVCPYPGTDRADLDERQANQLSCMNAVAARAAQKGILAAYHPNSPEGSVCRTRGDYDRMLNGLDGNVLKWVPDVGHMTKGGMDPLAVMKTFRPLIAHVHYKDMTGDGQWAMMGKGIIDFESITSFLRDTGYSGWLVVEDESPEAEAEPDKVASLDGAYMKQRLAPLVAS